MEAALVRLDEQLIVARRIDCSVAGGRVARTALLGRHRCGLDGMASLIVRQLIFTA